jgi:hypothetical protein
MPSLPAPSPAKADWLQRRNTIGFARLDRMRNLKRPAALEDHGCPQLWNAEKM